MKLIKQLLIIFFLILSINSNAQNDQIRNGVLRVRLPKLNYRDKIQIFNEDGSIYAIVKRNLDDEFEIRDAKSQLNNELLKNARAFYLDYGILIFDADSIIKNGKCITYLSNARKYINIKGMGEKIRYERWSKFFNGIFVKLSNNNSLFKDTLDLKRPISDGSKYSYIVKKISNDWIYVECAKTCEECPQNKILKGWIRWRIGKKLLIELYYFC